MITGLGKLQEFCQDWKKKMTCLPTGWLVDTTGSYTASFLLCGFSMIFSSTLLCFARLAKKIKRTRLRSLTNDTHSKHHIWTNGAIAYSVTGELDQKDAELLSVDTSSYSNRWQALSKFSAVQPWLRQRGLHRDTMLKMLLLWNKASPLDFYVRFW